MRSTSPAPANVHAHRAWTLQNSRAGRISRSFHPGPPPRAVGRCDAIQCAPYDTRCTTQCVQYDTVYDHPFPLSMYLRITYLKLLVFYLSCLSIGGVRRAEEEEDVAMGMKDGVEEEDGAMGMKDRARVLGNRGRGKQIEGSEWNGRDATRRRIEMNYEGPAKIGRKQAALEAKLQLLAEERQLILRRLDAVVYPVLTLPDDITAEIFSTNPSIDDCAFKTYPPLLLASVCRIWRKLALSYPRLWASLRLYWDSETVILREQLLRSWLTRTGGCLIDLTLHGPDLTEPICDAIADSGKCASASCVSLPWNQLTTLDLSDVTPFLEVLRHTPHLEVLSFSGISDLGGEETLVPIVMAKLHTLKIDPSCSSNANPLSISRHLLYKHWNLGINQTSHHCVP
ncbi:hypothetical protein C8J57DRAFT_1630925 [Mycena rebaudengoi]|nr:hypothetical protein C8J57DRAFT_1630925 [Mycena rebaudengoi]